MVANNDREQQKTTNLGKRSFLKKAAYVAPAVLTLSAMPFTASYGSAGSYKDKKEKSYTTVEKISVKSDGTEKLKIKVEKIK